jgi:hypothetical protein
MTTVALTQRKLDQLRIRLLGMQAGSIEVVDAKVEPQFDHAGEEYVEVTLVLSDPPDGADTWSLDDAFALRQEVRRVAADDLEIDERVAIAFGASVGYDVVGDDDETEDAV